MAKKKAEPKVVIHNFVAKHMHEVNQSQVFVDRKKNAKRGYDKHKKGRYSDDYLPFLMPLLWVSRPLSRHNTCCGFDHIGQTMGFKIRFHLTFHNEWITHFQGTL